MAKEYHYRPENVCSREFIFELSDDGTIEGFKAVGGCNGNLQGEGRLLKGRSLDEAIALLEGIECPGSRTGKTSCPDQIAKALKAYKAGNR
jgi:uncharacterized protein (TIGR03905 family)